MKIIAATSCPVGMAHTHMAAAALKKLAKKYDFEVKVETQGAMGIQNRLTKEDIESADLFIKACDVAIVEPDRFNDIQIFETSTSNLIKKGSKTIEEAILLIKGE